LETSPRSGLQPVIRRKEFPGQGEQFSIAWMIQRLDANNVWRNTGLITLEIRSQFFLRTRRTCDQYASGLGQGFAYTPEEGFSTGTWPLSPEFAL
jgi:hypothetical protein